MGVYAVLSQRWPPAGVAVGAAGAGSRLLRSLLYEVRPLDLTVLGLVTALLVTVALLASWLPAARAASTEPVEALKAG